MRFVLTRAWRPGVLLSGAMLMAACGTVSDADIANGDDPMRALEVQPLSSRYNSTYWQTQAERDPALWNRAVTYCEAHRNAATGAKPNCGSVFNAQFEIEGRKPPVPRVRRDVDQKVFRP